MELAVVDDHAVRDLQQVRLKLHFEDATILSALQIHEGLRDSWFLLGRHLHSIADLASHIVIAFGLRSSCPHGISLRMEGFTLPPSQPVGLLKDKDTVSVHKKRISSNHQEGEHRYSSSFDTLEKVAPIGVKTHALEEFEKETGGYESEEEEEKDAREASLDEVYDRLPEPSSLKLRKKKRKREKMGRDEEQGLEMIPYGGGVSNKADKGKKLKKQRLGDQQVESQNEQHTNGGAQCQLKREGQEAECSKVAKVKEKKRCKATSSKGDNSIKNQCNVNGSKKNISVSSDDSSEKEIKDEKNSAGLQKEGEIVKKCSRSTLRKKAKRRWKRENPGAPIKLTNKLGVEPVKPPVDNAGAEQVFPVSSAKHEDDGDAEEERLPRVVRPGHIRFQTSEEDESGNVGPPQNHVQPFLGWTNGISKRKGQSWGQEKSKRGNNNFQAASDMEIGDMQELNLENLPAMEGTPQNGDIIAYRILELTSSFCPELSEYRVGKVLDVESQTGKLTLAEVPKYTLWKPNENNQPSCVDGFLETEISSLSEIRLVERSAYETGKSASPVEASAVMPLHDKETNLNIGADAGFNLNKLNDANLNSSKALSPVDKHETLLPGWMEISDALQRKREELGGKEETTVLGDTERGNNGELEKKETASELEKQAIESGGSTAVKRSSDGGSAVRAKAWHKRAGGLGSTMALLRSQNVV